MGGRTQAERGGFSRGSDYKLLELLELRLKSLSLSELEGLRSLMILHGFLPS